MKVRNLQANHNITPQAGAVYNAVLASMKVRNLKANHNLFPEPNFLAPAVLASMKVRNLKANHNGTKWLLPSMAGCISKYEGTKSES